MDKMSYNRQILSPYILAMSIKSLSLPLCRRFQSLAKAAEIAAVDQIAYRHVLLPKENSSSVLSRRLPLTQLRLRKRNSSTLTSAVYATIRKVKLLDPLTMAIVKS